MIACRWNKRCHNNGGTVALPLFSTVTVLGRKSSCREKGRLTVIFFGQENIVDKFGETHHQPFGRLVVYTGAVQ